MRGGQHVCRYSLYLLYWYKSIFLLLLLELQAEEKAIKGTDFTRFTSTKVQILTQNALGSEASGPSHGVPPRSILKY
jgi:hypothetical protein